MNYKFEELKKQTISLDFSKQEEIIDLNLEQFKQYLILRINFTNEDIKSEIELLNSPKIKNLEELYRNTKLVLRSEKLPFLIPTLHLLNRIKIDLDNIDE